MKRLFAFFLLGLFCLQLVSQPANNWIDYSRTYFKFYTEEDALHRIDYFALIGGGMTNPIVGADLQMYTAGAQIPIYVSTSGTFGAGDFIEFYGRRNDGKFDTQLYANPAHQNHDEISLFSDKAAHYITTVPSGNNLRYQTTANNLTNLPAAESYFMHEETSIPFNFHHRGEPKTDVGGAKIWFADFEKGEGYTSQRVASNSNQINRLSTRSQYTGAAPPVEVKVNVVGLDDSVGAFLDQHCKVYVQSYDHPNPTSTTPEIDDQFIAYDIRRYNFTIPQSQLGLVATDITLQALDGFVSIFSFQSKFASTYASITYPHTFDFESKKSFAFNVDVNADKYFEITNFSGSSGPVVLLDKTAMRRYEITQVNGVYKIKIPYDANFPGTHEFYLSSTSSSEMVNVSPLDIEQRNFVDYSLPVFQGDYLMIYHTSLNQGSTQYVTEYSKYRQSDLTTLSGHSSPVRTFNKVMGVPIEQLYDQFAQGIENHPLAIQNFVNYILIGPNAWPAQPEHMFLIGKSIDYPSFRANQTNFDNCLVPTYGYQPSDNKLSTANVFDYRPQLGTGRLSARNANDVRVYLEKLIEYEQLVSAVENDCSVAARKQMKQILFATKGWGTGEANQFYQYTSGYQQIVQSNNTGWNIAEDLIDNTDHAPGPVRPELATAINDGLAMIVYTGHGIGQYWEFNGHHDNGPTTLAPSNFSNQGKYPFLLSNACFVGNIHTPQGGSQGEDYLLEEDGGAIGSIASVTLAYPSFLDIFSKRFLNNMTSNYYGATVGQLIKQSIREIYDPVSTGVKAVGLEMTYAGDPTIELYNFDNPSYLLDNVTELSSGASTNDVQVSIFNTGKAVPAQQLEVQITSTNGAGVSTVHPVQNIFAPGWYGDYTFSVPANGPGPYTYSVVLDPNDLITEDCEGNCPQNIVTSGSTTSYQANANITSNSVIVDIPTTYQAGQCVEMLTGFQYDVTGNSNATFHAFIDDCP